MLQPELVGGTNFRYQSCLETIQKHTSKQCLLLLGLQEFVPPGPSLPFFNNGWLIDSVMRRIWCLLVMLSFFLFMMVFRRWLTGNKGISKITPCCSQVCYNREGFFQSTDILDDSSLHFPTYFDDLTAHQQSKNGSYYTVYLSSWTLNLYCIRNFVCLFYC